MRCGLGKGVAWRRIQGLYAGSFLLQVLANLIQMVHTVIARNAWDLEVWLETLVVTGLRVLWLVVFGGGGGDPLMAEITTLKIGLNLLWDRRIRSAVCEVDCKEIADTLHGDQFHFHQLANEFGEIRRLLERDWTIQIAHIPRSANDAAYYLAGLGAIRQCVTLYSEDLPP